MLFMLYLALGTYEWQLCSALQRFTSCASAVSAIIEQHVLLYKLKKEKSIYIQKATSCVSHPGNTATEMKVKKNKTRPYIKHTRPAWLSATEKADEAMLFFEKTSVC